MMAEEKVRREQERLEQEFQRKLNLQHESSMAKEREKVSIHARFLFPCYI